MTLAEFCTAVQVLGTLHGLSVTSWGRTEERNRLVGGHPLSWHRMWMAVDVVPDDPAVLDDLKVTAVRFWLEVIDEGDHWHIEPRG